MNKNPKTALIYTGGTLGMEKTKDVLSPIKLHDLVLQLPELQLLEVDITFIPWEMPIDSADVNIIFYQQLAHLINNEIQNFDGFVIIHGTDTMCYTASALSFMLMNIHKPIVLTGAQLPSNVLRSDAKRNLITSIQIAAEAKINEVCICFNNHIYRGNRTSKIRSNSFDAFESSRFSPLAEIGVSIRYNEIKQSKKENYQFHPNLSNKIELLWLFPGVSISKYLQENNNIEGILLLSYGSGTAPNDKEFISTISSFVDRGIHILNVSQCREGRVQHGKYVSNENLNSIGVINGLDITIESGITKMMHVLGTYPNELKRLKLKSSLSGETTE